MAILSEKDAKKILDKVLSYSKADECEVNLNGSTGGNIRYALNSVTTSGYQDDVNLSIQSTYGKKVGTATTNEFDNQALEATVRRAEELARLAPENPEYMPRLGPQTYKASKDCWADTTATITPAYRAQAAAHSIKPCREKNLSAAGFLTDQGGFRAMANTNGLFAYHQETSVNFTATIRTQDGTGSGWVSRDYNDVSKLDTGKASRIAMDKAEGSVNAKAIEPGKYTVILEPIAAADLMFRIFGAFNQRSADEGRSFMSKKGGGNKLGEKIVDERISIYSDPWHPDVPYAPWNGEGQAREKTYWIKDGVVQNLFVSRYWAKEKGVNAMPGPESGIVSGGDASVEDLIKDTRKGILVTRLWYIRFVDPQTLLFTGLTRDGTFFIENGKIKHPIKNLRFNESPIIMLNNLEALGKQQRYQGSLIPAMKIRDFTFTSSSDAV